MAKATVEKVMEEIKALTPDDLEQVRKLLDEMKSEQSSPSPPEAEAVARIDDYLIKAGLLAPEMAGQRARPVVLDHEPVDIVGKPISETVIEERR